VENDQKVLKPKHLKGGAPQWPLSLVKQEILKRGRSKTATFPYQANK